jgi:F5/8 type C domain
VDKPSQPFERTKKRCVSFAYVMLLLVLPVASQCATYQDHSQALDDGATGGLSAFGGAGAGGDSSLMAGLGGASGGSADQSGGSSGALVNGGSVGSSGAGSGGGPNGAAGSAGSPTGGNNQVGGNANGNAGASTGGNPGGGTLAGGSAGQAMGGGSAGASPTEQLLSKNKPATSDSTQANRGAALGNDGDNATRWCAADSGLNHYWRVDLGSSFTLSRVQLLWEQAVAYQFKIESSADASNWTLILDQSQSTSTSATQTYQLPAAATGRYVRLTVTGGLTSTTWASFFELQVFGH